MKTENSAAKFETWHRGGEMAGTKAFDFLSRVDLTLLYVMVKDRTLLLRSDCTGVSF